ncbi:hypothetical protein BDV59DRAFT_54925 [Aspergillus ambiguus]|uniref:uncharacterized protein n=1 Tax=Aspergillus ambiguus TaxID=176160 RepID=UPI003CCE0597
MCHYDVIGVDIRWWFVSCYDLLVSLVRGMTCYHYGPAMSYESFFSSFSSLPLTFWFSALVLVCVGMKDGPGIFLPATAGQTSITIPKPVVVFRPHGTM